MLMQSPLVRCACLSGAGRAGWFAAGGTVGTGELARGAGGIACAALLLPLCPSSMQPTPATCTPGRAALEGLRSSDTFFSAVDSVVELIYCTSQRGRPKEDMAPLVQLIVAEVMALKPR